MNTDELSRALHPIAPEVGQSVADAIAARITQRILERHELFVVGAKLSAKTIAEALDIGRRQVNAALGLLAEQGYLDVSQGRPAEIVTANVGHLPARGQRAAELPSASSLICTAYPDFITIVPTFSSRGSVRGLILEREEAALREEIERAIAKLRPPATWLRLLRLRLVEHEHATRLLFVELLYVPEGVRWAGRSIDDLIIGGRERLERGHSVYELYKDSGLSLVHGSQSVDVGELPAHTRAFLESNAFAEDYPKLTRLQTRAPEGWLRVCGTVWAKQIAVPMHHSIAFFNAAFARLSLQRIDALDGPTTWT